MNITRVSLLAVAGLLASLSMSGCKKEEPKPAAQLNKAGSDLKAGANQASKDAKTAADSAAKQVNDAATANHN